MRSRHSASIASAGDGFPLSKRFLDRYKFFMSEHESIIRYDGPALAGHKMDVEDISPALLALADLCKLVNKIANDDRASVRLYIDLDVEQHCAQFKLQVVQTFLEHAKTFLGDEHVVTAGRNLWNIGRDLRDRWSSWPI